MTDTEWLNLEKKITTAGGIVLLNSKLAGEKIVLGIYENDVARACASTKLVGYTLSEMRLIADDAERFRRLHDIKRFFGGHYIECVLPEEFAKRVDAPADQLTLE